MGAVWCPEERDEDDDPVERALSDYQMAFEEAGDTQAASALEEALDLVRGLPTRPPEDYAPDDDWDREWEWHADREWESHAGGAGAERGRSSLAPLPKPSRSIFDDIDR
jgi:hypothetical protein